MRKFVHLFIALGCCVFVLAGVPANANPQATPTVRWTKYFDDQTDGRTGHTWVIGQIVFAQVGPCVDCPPYGGSIRAYALDTGQSLYGVQPAQRDEHLQFGADGIFRAQRDEPTLSDYLIGYDIQTGRERWNIVTDYTVDGLTSGGGRVFTYERDEATGNTIYRAYDATSGELLWQTEPLSAPGFSSLAVLGLGLFAGHSCGQVDRLDVATGDVVWRRTRACTGATPYWVPDLYGDRLYVREGGNAYQVVSRTTGADLGARIWGAPPVIDRTVGMGYFVSTGTPVVTGSYLPDQTTRWRFTPPIGLSGLDAGAGRVAVVTPPGAQGSTIYLRDGRTGAARWEARNPDSVMNHLAPGVAVTQDVTVAAWGLELVAYNN